MFCIVIFVFVCWLLFGFLWELALEGSEWNEPIPKIGREVGNGRVVNKENRGERRMRRRGGKVGRRQHATWTLKPPNIPLLFFVPLSNLAVLPPTFSVASPSALSLSLSVFLYKRIDRNKSNNARNNNIHHEKWAIDTRNLTKKRDCVCREHTYDLVAAHTRPLFVMLSLYVANRGENFDTLFLFVCGGGDWWAPFSCFDRVLPLSVLFFFTLHAIFWRENSGLSYDKDRTQDSPLPRGHTNRTFLRLLPGECSWPFLGADHSSPCDW